MNDRIFFDEYEQTNVGAVPDLSALAHEEILPENSVLLKLTISGCDFKKTINSDDLVHDGDEIDSRLINAQKRLIDKQYLKDIQKLDSHVRRMLYDIGFRPKFLGQGTVIIPLGVFNYTISILDRYEADRAVLIERLFERYEEAKRDVALRSPQTYCEDEYPTVDELREVFKVDRNFFSVSFPKVLEKLSEQAATDVYKNEKQKYNEQMNEAMTEIKQALRGGFVELVDGMLDKVRGIGTERKVFREGFVEKWKIFLDTFDGKNLSNDTELAALVAQARGVLSGVSPDNIKNSVETRINIENSLSEIKNNLDGMIGNVKRKARFA